MYQQQSMMGGMPMGHAAAIADSQPSCLSLVAPPPQFGPQCIPAYPQMPDVHPVIQQNLAAISLALGVSLVERCGKNAAFMYLYNTCVITGFRDDNWLRCVQFCAMLVWKFTIQRQNVSLQSIISDAANSTVIYKASIMAISNAAVFSHLDMATRNEVQTYAQEHENLRMEFSTMVQQFQQQVQIQANPQLAYGGVVGQAMAANNQPTQPVNPFAGAYQQPTGQQTPSGAFGANMPATKPPAVTRPAAPLYDFDAPIAPAVTAPAVVQAPVVEQPVQRENTVTEFFGNQPGTRVIEEPQYTDESNWAPSAIQRYRPAVYLFNTKLIHEVVKSDTGELIVLAMPVQVEEKEIEEDLKMNNDRSRYHVPGLNRAIAGAMNHQRKEEAAFKTVRDLDLIAKGMTQTQVKESPAVVEMFERQKIDANTNRTKFDVENVHSVQEAVSEARQYHQISDNEQDSFFHCRGRMAVDIVVADGGADLLQKVKDVTSYKQAVDVLNALVDKNLNNLQVLRAAKRFDSYLTKQFNHMLNVNMGLTSVYIDSFKTDVLDCLDHLAPAFGRAYVEQAMAHQKKFFEYAFNNASVLEITSEVPRMVDGDEPGASTVEYDTVVKGEVVSVGRDITVTLLEMDSKELAIELAQGKVSQIFATNFPGLQPYFEAIIKANPGAINYVVTADDVVYGVEMSIMNDQTDIVVIYYAE